MARFYDTSKGNAEMSADVARGAFYIGAEQQGWDMQDASDVWSRIDTDEEARDLVQDTVNYEFEIVAE